MSDTPRTERLLATMEHEKQDIRMESRARDDGTHTTMYTGRDLEVIIKAARADARREAIEECATVCDLLAGLSVQGWGRKSTSAARKCAEEIRAIKLPEQAIVAIKKATDGK